MKRVPSEVFRGGVFYVRDNFWKIIGLLFFAVFIPMGLTLLFQQSVLNALFGLQFSSTSTTAFQTWMNPSTRNYGMLLLYYFMETLLGNCLYFWFPLVWISAFFRFRSLKLNQMQQPVPIAEDGKEKTICENYGTPS